jgi:hypothetical protein
MDSEHDDLSLRPTNPCPLTEDRWLGGPLPAPPRVPVFPSEAEAFAAMVEIGTYDQLRQRKIARKVAQSMRNEGYRWDGTLDMWVKE